MRSRQNIDGSWGGVESSSVRPIQATAAVLEALLMVDGTGSALDAGRVWLAGQASVITEEIACRCALLGADPLSGSSSCTELQSPKQLEGWGVDSTYPSELLDTLLSLDALATSGLADANQIQGAMESLLSAQRDDGGWGFGDNHSDVFLTGAVLATLVRHRALFSVEEGIDGGIAFLQAEYGPDGRIGDGLIATAMAYRSSIEAGADVASLFPATSFYLASAQAADGSWDHDEYTTAVALRALMLEKPNLVVQRGDVAFSQPFPHEGETISITATVRNAGPAAAENVVVRLVDGDLSDGIAIGEPIIVGILPAYASTSITSSWDTTKRAGNRRITVQTDPDDAIAENCETDNTASVDVTVSTLPDLVVGPGDVQISPAIARSSDELVVTATVRNTGQTAAENVDVVMYTGDPESGGASLGAQSVPQFAGGSEAKLTWKGYLAAGAQTLTVVVDPGQAITEMSEANNRASAALYVYPTTDDLADLELQSVSVQPSVVNEVETATVQATVKNIGRIDAQGFTVELWKKDGSGAAGVVASTQVPGLALNAQATLNWTVSLPAGEYDLTAKVDAASAISESNEINNEGTCNLRVLPTNTSLPDLALDAAALSYVPLNPTSQDVITVTTVLRNLGNAVATGPLDVGTGVNLYDGDPALGGEYVGGHYLGSVASGAEREVSITATLPEGSHDLYVIADAGYVIPEIDEANNALSFHVEVRPPLPDLSASMGDVSFAPLFPTEAEDVTIFATVRNFSSVAAQNVRLMLREGLPPGGVVLLDTTVAEVPGNGWATVQATGQFPIGDHQFFLEIDPDDGIVEWSEANNVMTSNLVVVTPPDLAIGVETLTVTPSTPVANRKAVFSLDIHNFGGRAAEMFRVGFYDGDPSQNGTPLGEPFVVSKLHEQGEIRIEKAAFLSPGVHEIFISVDPEDRIREGSKANNTAMLTIVVGEEANLRFTGQPGLSPSEPVAAAPVSISTLVRNDGTAAVTNVIVDFRESYPEAEGVVLGEVTLPSLAGGAESPVQFVAVFEAGYHEVVVRADAPNTIAESKEQDNEIVVGVYVPAAEGDVAIKSEGLILKPSLPVAGGAVSVEAEVWNFGDVGRSGVTVAFYDGVGPDSELLGSTVVDLAAGASAIASLDIVLEAGDHVMMAVADPDHLLQEASAANNRTRKEVMVSSGVAGIYQDSGNPSANTHCVQGSDAVLAQSPDLALPLRTVSMDSVAVRYSFDDLSPEEAYRLTIVAIQDPDSGRVQKVSIDGKLAINSYAVGTEAPTITTVVVPRDLYQDGAILVSVEGLNGAGAIVSELYLIPESGDKELAIYQGASWLERRGNSWSNGTYVGWEPGYEALRTAKSFAAYRANGRLSDPKYELLRQRLYSLQAPDYSWEMDVVSTARAIIALVEAGEDSGGERIANAIWWLRRQANADGGWGTMKGVPSDPSATGVALMALVIAGVDKTDASCTSGVHWLKSTQNPTGYWSYAPGGSDTISVGPWPAIGLTLATSLQDAEALAARSRFYSLTNEHWNFYSVWEEFIRMSFYCGTTPASLLWYERNYLALGQTSSGGWVSEGNYSLYPDWALTASALEMLGRAGWAAQVSVNNIDRGFGWLDAHIAADGSATNLMMELAPPVSSVVVMALQQAGALGSQALLERGAKTLVEQQHYWRRGFWPYRFFYDDHGSTYPSAHAIITLSATSYASSGALYSAASFLSNVQNTDGGWSYYKFASSQVYETALVLSALLKTGYSPTGGTITRGLAWLLSKQGADGGWGNTRDTAQAALALIGEARHQVELDRALDWILGTQNVDGGWGSSWGQPGNIDNTSQALIALAASGERGMAVARGVSWLVSAQNSDGGWGAVPKGQSSNSGSTGLAVWALAVSHPNSDVELEIFFNKPWYYPSDLVSMIVNPLNETVEYLNLTGSLQNQYGETATLPVTVSGEGFESEYTVPADALPGLSTVTFLAASDDAQGTQTASFVVKDASNALPDLEITAEDVVLDNESPQIGDQVTCSVTIRNTETIDAHNVTVRAYRGVEATPNAQLGIDLFIERIPGLGASTVSFSYSASDETRQLLVVVDPDGGIPETREDNNTADRWVFVQGTVARADLRVLSEEIAVEPSAPYSGEALAISAIIRNIGTLSASTTAVRFYDADPRVGGFPLGPDVAVPSLGPGESAAVAIGFDSLGRSGRLYVYAVADPDRVVEETSENNNTAFSFVELRQMTLPDLQIPQGGVVLSRPDVLEGESVAVSVTVENRGLAASNVAVALYDGDPTSGGMPIGTVKSIAGVFPQSESRTVTFTWETTGAGGRHQLYAVADPSGAVAEVFEDNNVASVTLDVFEANLQVDVSTPQSSYGADTSVSILVVTGNLGDAAANVALQVSVQDSAGAVVADVAEEQLSLGARGGRTSSFSWNTGSTRDGAYVITARVLQEGRSVAEDAADFSINPDVTVIAGVATDKISYVSNETARISWSLASGSANHDFTKLTATLTLADPTGVVLFSDQRAVASLMRGQRVVFDAYWGVATQPPGSYPLAVRITDGVTQLAEVHGALTISEEVNPESLLAGTISVAPQTIFSGNDEMISYAVRNVGNRDLARVDLTVNVIGARQQTVFAELTDGTALAMRAEFSASQAVLTEGFEAGDYLAVLAGSVDGVSATLASTYFRIQGAPSVPSLNSPAAGSEVTTFTPTLVVNNATDPNALDTLRYFFEVYGDAGLTQLVAFGGPLDEGEGTTAWPLATVLSENTRYWWRCRAYDAWSYGPWMDAATFFVNTVNDPPGPPAADHPVAGQEVDTLSPALSVRNAFDPDEDNLTYNFKVAADPAMATVVAESKGVFETPGTTAWTVEPPLAENTWYWWSAQAEDWLDVGPWMDPVSFFVNTANDAPTAPTPVSPTDGSETASAVTLLVGNAMDFDSSVLTYVFEIDSEPTFTTPNRIESGMRPEGAGATSWDVPSALNENARYYWRAKASDGQAESVWSGAFSFLVNEVNEAPTAPVLANPSDGGEALFLQPEVVVHNATDPDGDVLTYEFEVYQDAELTTLVAEAAGVSAGDGQTAWTVSAPLTENSHYWWRARAFDGELAGPWMALASFIVNTANDAPTAPALVAPADGAVADLLQPLLTIGNAFDPDGDPLTYQYEVYADAGLTVPEASIQGIAEGPDLTVWTISTALLDDHQYWWRARAFDGEHLGPWMETAHFTIHLPVQSIAGTVNFDPDTLNLGSRGTWVTVYVELPAGYDAWSINPATVTLNGVVPAETRPAAYGDVDKDGIPDAMFKFRRSAVEAILMPGERVVVTVTGMAGTMAFEGIDIIRVINP